MKRILATVGLMGTMILQGCCVSCAKPPKMNDAPKTGTTKEQQPMADATPKLVEVSKKAPSITLKDQDGKTHKLADYSGQWLVLYFYPKDNTPGCTTQACGFRDDLPDFSKLNAKILGVSPDSEASHQKFIAKQSLNFDLLADTENKVATRYGVWQEKKNFGKVYMGIVRTTYLISPDGKIAHRWDKVKVKTHAQDVQDKIKELSK